MTHQRREMQMFVQNSLSLKSYTQQELLDIGLQNSDCFINNLQLIPEVRRTPDAMQPTWPAGIACRRCRDHKQKWRIIYPFSSLMCDHWRKLKLWITHNKRLMDYNVMVFIKTWLHIGVPNNAIKLTGYYSLQADKTVDKRRGLWIYINKAWCSNSVIVGRHCSTNLKFFMV